MLTTTRNLLVLSLFLFCGACANSHLGQGAPAREVNLLAMADWGMLNQNQKTVAAGMARYVSASNKDYDGLVTGGDNIYIQLKNADDPQWEAIFERMYDPAVLNFPFYITPGNHDYEHGKIGIELAYARQNPTSRWTFPSPYYRLDFPEGSDGNTRPLVTVLMLDSCKDQMGQQAWNAEKDWLRRELANPNNGEWLFCVAHHPLYSNGDHGDNGVLQREWGPLFAQHHVDMYICGHDHDLQHLEMPGLKTTFILVGGGGATVRTMRNDRRGPFSKSIYGFTDISVTPESCSVKFVGTDGEIVHAFERTRSGDVRVIESRKSDVAVPRTPRSINRSELPETRPATTQKN